MSKKKAFSGSTMTLKDFHGGSIPSDLPLPSAPGATVRPTERQNYDRQSAWGGGAAGRPDYRGRPNSSSSTRTFDDKTPFLATPAHIGRNFDEDERKPIDGNSGPRRTVSDEILYPPTIRVEVKPGSVPQGKVTGRPGSGLAPGIPIAVAQVNSYSSRVSDRGQVEVNPLSMGGQSSAHINVWAARKEAAVVAEVRPPAWSEEVVASKLAHASALDKVSSGRWQTKLLVSQQTEVEVIQFLQTENGLTPKIHNPYSGHGLRMAQEGESHDSLLAKHAERVLSISESGHNIHKEVPNLVKESAPIHKTSFGNNTSNIDGAQPPNVQSGGLGLHPSSEPSERPRLNLLPRSKPLENPQPTAVDYKQESGLPIKPSSSGSDIENRAEERPKLNIQPRSQPQPPQQLQVTTEKERNALFGGARPREFVLKERGIDTDPADLSQSPIRMKNEVVKSEAPHVNPPIRHQERADNQSLDQRAGRKIERKDNRVDNDKAVNRANWRNDGRKAVPETEKQQKERQPSPETWRKPSPDTSSTGVRFGKAASAVELAQAFSRSTSAPKASEKSRTLPSVPGRSPVPFSRLTVPDSRPHINGH
uniref:Eukaryotic translation initiation factor-related n=1 Tax=Kalanchoe fedtschenkoi TaxID=63787 RepID=A0A7N0V9R5_KALFE